MTKQYYQLSTDYDLVDKWIKEGQTFVALLTINETTAYHVINESTPLDYRNYYAQFLLPIHDPTIGLQHSLTQALNECDELRNDLTVANAAIEELSRQIEVLESRLEFTQAQVRNRDKTSDELRAVIEQNKNAFSDSLKSAIDLIGLRDKTIDILGDNLNQSETDRLAQLTAIMRMIQALDKTPQPNLVGALYLIKRVLYEAICKLDPNQAIDL